MTLGSRSNECPNAPLKSLFLCHLPISVRGYDFFIPASAKVVGGGSSAAPIGVDTLPFKSPSGAPLDIP